MVKRHSRRIVALVVSGVFLIAAIGQSAALCAGLRECLLDLWRHLHACRVRARRCVLEHPRRCDLLQEIAEFALTLCSDVIALPETEVVVAGEIGAILAAHGLTMWSSTVGYGIPTSVPISTDLGSYQLDAAAGPTPGLPSGVWLPHNGTSPPWGAVPGPEQCRHRCGRSQREPNHLGALPDVVTRVRRRHKRPPERGPRPHLNRSRHRSITFSRPI
jgi:hypothetical protein